MIKEREIEDTRIAVFYDGKKGRSVSLQSINKASKETTTKHYHQACKCIKIDQPDNETKYPRIDFDSKDWPTAKITCGACEAEWIPNKV